MTLTGYNVGNALECDLFMLQGGKGSLECDLNMVKGGVGSRV